MGWKRLRLRLAISGIAFAPLSLYISIHLCTTHELNAYTQYYCISPMHSAPQWHTLHPLQIKQLDKAIALHAASCKAGPPCPVS